MVLPRSKIDYTGLKHRAETGLMTVKTTREYTCTVCRRNLDSAALGTPPTMYPEGWALTWCGPGTVRPETGATLEPTRTWPESPVHLCKVCVEAIAKFRESAIAAGEL